MNSSPKDLGAGRKFKRTPCGEIPVDWACVELGEVCDVEGGSTPRVNVPAYWNGEIPWVTPSEITKLQSKYIEDTKRHITEAGLKAISAELLPAGSVLMTSRATVGYCAINTVPMVTNQGFASLICEDGVHNRFLFYRITASRSVLESLAGGSTFKEVGRSAVRRMPIALPPLSEQRKIAEILESVDAAIEKTKAVIEQVKVVKKGLTQQLLTRGLPGRHRRFKQTPIGEIPEEWEVVMLRSVGDGSRPAIRTGPFGSSLKTIHFTQSGVPVITIGSLGAGRFIEAELFYVSGETARELEEYKVREGDLVFSRVADVGRSVVVDSRSHGWLMSSNLIRICPDKTRIDSRFLLESVVGSPLVLHQLGLTIADGGRQVMTAPVLRTIRVPLPDLGEQEEIVRAGRQVQASIELAETQLTRQETLKQGLMRVLLTGRVRVGLESRLESRLKPGVEGGPPEGGTPNGEERRGTGDVRLEKDDPTTA